MEAFASGGMRMAFRAKLAVENKNPLLSDFKVGDDVVIKDYIDTIKDQANEKGRNLRKMAMKVWVCLSFSQIRLWTVGITSIFRTYSQWSS